MIFKSRRTPWDMAFFGLIGTILSLGALLFLAFAPRGIGGVYGLTIYDINNLHTARGFVIVEGEGNLYISVTGNASVYFGVKYVRHPRVARWRPLPLFVADSRNLTTEDAITYSEHEPMTFQHVSTHFRRTDRVTSGVHIYSLDINNINDFEINIVRQGLDWWVVLRNVFVFVGLGIHPFLIWWRVRELRNAY